MKRGIPFLVLFLYYYGSRFAHKFCSHSFDKEKILVGDILGLIVESFYGEMAMHEKAKRLEQKLAEKKISRRKKMREVKTLANSWFLALLLMMKTLITNEK